MSFLPFFSFRTTNRALPRFSSNSPSGGTEYYLVLLFPVTTTAQVALKGRKLPCSPCAGIPSNGIHSAKPDQQEKEQNKHAYSLVVRALTCKIGNLIFSFSTQALTGAEAEHILLRHIPPWTEFDTSTIPP